MKEKELNKISENMLQIFPLFKVLFKTEGVEGLNSEIPNFKSHTYHILGILNGRGPLPISVIGKRLFIAKQNMTTLTNKLIQDGLLERQNDMNDRRVINIAITRKGVDVLMSGKQMQKEILRNNLSKLNEEDMDILSKSLEVIIKILNKVK